jgi:hypothetical protein
MRRPPGPVRINGQISIKDLPAAKMVRCAAESSFERRRDAKRPGINFTSRHQVKKQPFQALTPSRHISETMPISYGNYDIKRRFIRF